MTPEEEQRARELRAMQRRATGLLLVVTAVFVAGVAAGDRSWATWLRAAAEGSMVGGLADWFAVTALFRRPLGLPIPHTAVIRERKDQFGATLGEFVQANFLSADNLVERVRTSDVTARAAAWLAHPDHAREVAGRLAEALAELAEVVRDDDVHALVDEEVERVVDRLPVAALAARGLELATADGRHQQVLDALLRGVGAYLDENRRALRERFAGESPWWLPGAAQDRIFERILDGARAWTASIVADPRHELRDTFDERVRDFVARLRTDPVLAARAEEIKADVVSHPELRAWLAELWSDVKDGLRTAAGDADSHLRRRVADAVAAGGERLAEDPVLRGRVDAAVERAVHTLVTNYGDEIGDLIGATIARWDGEETSRKLELLLGRDLQFIRINGTVVGAVAGLAIHAAGAALG